MMKPNNLIRVRYSSNNSGGFWWLEDSDWKNLEKEGWEVKWVKDNGNIYCKPDKDGRWLGALAMEAISPPVKSMKHAISNWEKILDYDADDEGCSCCGSPHNFYKYEEN